MGWDLGKRPHHHHRPRPRRYFPRGPPGRNAVPCARTIPSNGCSLLGLFGHHHRSWQCYLQRSHTRTPCGVAAAAVHLGECDESWSPKHSTPPLHKETLHHHRLLFQIPNSRPGLGPARLVPRTFRRAADDDAVVAVVVVNARRLDRSSTPRCSSCCC